MGGLGGFVEKATAIKGLFDIGTYIYDGISERRKKGTCSQEELKEAYNRKVEELAERERQILNQTNEYQSKIKELEIKIEKQIDYQKKILMAKEKEELENKKEKEELRRKEIQEKMEAIKNCKESLSYEFQLGIINAFQEITKEQEIWINQLEENDITKYKEQLLSLFNKLFENENIISKINEKFIKIIKNKFTNKELKKLNVLIIGPSGVGKSTLINALLREELAKEGLGERCTTKGQKYQSEKYPFLCLFDSVGAEIGNGHTLKDVQMQTINSVMEKLNNPDPNEHIHCLIYCVTSNRVFNDESKTLLNLREIYKGDKLPIIIVYTKANKKKEIEAVKDTMNKFLYENHKEKIGDGIFDINFLEVYAKEEEINVNDISICQKCFGLSNLVSTCYKKCKQSYKCSIKNSLIQIGKDYFENYIKEISNEILVNIFSFSEKKFDPNFSNFIAYAFNKITNVNNNEDNKINELEFEEKGHNNDDFSEIEQHEENDSTLDSYKCIICKKKPIEPLKCESCNSFICNECYLKQFNYCDVPNCNKCNNTTFTECSNEEKDLIRDCFNQSNINYNLTNPENIYNNMDKKNGNNEQKNDKNKLQRDLCNESKKNINDYCEEFKNDMLKILEQKFNDFNQKQTDKIYNQLLEKYLEKAKSQNQDIRDAMKSKDEIKNEAANAIKENLKEKAEEFFLKKTSGILYQHIIDIFKTEMLNKINNFIENIENNDKIQQVFKSFKILEPPKKLEEEFNKYIETLKKIEDESNEKTKNQMNSYDSY